MNGGGEARQARRSATGAAFAARRSTRPTTTTWNRPPEHATTREPPLKDLQSTRRVLLVGLSDDEREIFGGCLRRMGFAVQPLADPEAALSMATDTPPAAIVTRIMQRGPIDGIELTRRVRAHPATRDVAVVVVTTRIEPEYGAAALDAGCDGFLLLPATAELVAYHVERGIASRTAHVEPPARPRLQPIGSPLQPVTSDAAAPLIMSTPGLVLSNEDAVRLMNAWRRLTAFVALVDLPSRRADGIALIREFVEPALDDLNRLADQIPRDLLAEANQAPSAWYPNLHDERWRRARPDGDKPRGA